MELKVLRKTTLRHGVLQTTEVFNYATSVSEARSQAARLFAITNLRQKDVAHLVNRSHDQVWRWCQEPSFQALVEHEKRLAATVMVPDLVDPEPDPVNGVVRVLKKLESKEQQAEAIRRRIRDDDDAGGEWSPEITTFHSKKSGGEKR